MQKKSSQNILTIAVLALVSTLLWIYLSIREIALSKKGETKPAPSEVTIISPKLDIEVFEELKKRKI